MDILIINLQSQKARLAFQLRQMEALGLAWERLDAISTQTLSEDTYQELANTWERPMRKTEVCCFLSHHAAWQIVQQRNRPCLILEDDALLASFVPHLLQDLEQRKGMDLVTLEVRGRKKIVGKIALPSVDNVTLRPLYQDRTGAAGYILWPAGASKLLTKSSEGRAGLADAFISNLYSLSAWQIEPAGLIQLDMCEHYGVQAPTQTQSTISNSAKPLAEQGSRWRFKLRRITAQLRMAWRALTVLHKAQRRFIKLNSPQFNLDPMAK